MINHPRLYITPAQIERAKKRIASEEWARKILNDLKHKADQALTLELPVYETAWWQEAKKRHWSTFYPEIWKHCGMVPGPPVHAAHSAALAYLITDENKYADRAKEILLHTTAFTFEFEHPDVGMHYSSLGLFSLQTYDMILDRFSPDERRKMQDFFDRAFAAVKKDDDWWIENNPGGMFNNHFAWHKLWIGTYGLYFGKDDLLQYAIDSDQGIRELMEHGLMDWGTWFESSLHYHFTALWAIVKMADMLRNCNNSFDLYTYRFANGRNVKQLFDGIVLTAFPDTTIPSIGDAYGKTLHLYDQPLFKAAYNAYKDPVYEWLLVKGGKKDADWLFWEKLPVKGEPPALSTQLFPEHGHVMLRSVEGKDYWDSDAFAAFFSHDINSVHSHNDKLDLILFGRGKLLLSDPEALATAPHAFSAQVQKELNRSTVCQNTLMIDGEEQHPIGQKLTLFEFKDLPGIKTASAGDLDGRIYPGVKMKRTVAVMDDYVLDVFEAKSDEEHNYQWLLHPCDDEGRIRTELNLRQSSLPGAVPWNWLKNPRSAVTDDDFRAEWVQDDVILRLTLSGSRGTKITVCDFPRYDTFEQPSHPMVIAERKEKSTIFVALYQAERKRVLDAVYTLKKERHNSLRISVKSNGRSTDHLITLLP